MEAIYSIVKKAAERWRLPEKLVHNQIAAESDYRADAVSSAGAVGLMQILPLTAADVGARFNLPVEPLDDPEINVNIGCAYMRYLLNIAFKYTDIPIKAYAAALIGYFAGPSRIKTVIDNSDEATRAEIDYAEKVLADIKGVDWKAVGPWTGDEKKKGVPWWLIIPAAWLFWRNRK